MATAIEYGLIAASIGVAIITVVNGIPGNSPRWDGNVDKKKAMELCAARPAGDTRNVVIKTWLGGQAEYKCSNWPKLSYPSFVRTVY